MEKIMEIITKITETPWFAIFAILSVAILLPSSCLTFLNFEKKYRDIARAKDSEDATNLTEPSQKNTLFVFSAAVVFFMEGFGCHLRETPLSDFSMFFYHLLGLFTAMESLIMYSHSSGGLLGDFIPSIERIALEKEKEKRNNEK